MNKTKKREVAKVKRVDRGKYSGHEKRSPDGINVVRAYRPLGIAASRSSGENVTCTYNPSTTSCGNLLYRSEYVHWPHTLDMPVVACEWYNMCVSTLRTLVQCYSKCGTLTGDDKRTIVCRYADIFQKREKQ